MEKETAEEFCAHIRAFHPWLKCYLAYRHKFLIPDPYNLEILENPQKTCIFNRKDNSIVVKCKDGKFVKMSNVDFY